MREFEGTKEPMPKPIKSRDIWPRLKQLLNLPDECVKAVRIDIELDGLVEVEIRKYAVVPPTFRSNVTDGEITP